MPLRDKRASIRVSGGKTLPYAPRLSPDGNWLAYTDQSTGMLEVHVQRFLAPADVCRSHMAALFTPGGLRTAAA
jgi:hypothetical protein